MTTWRSLVKRQSQSLLFCFVLWHLSPCGLFDAKSWLYIYIYISHHHHHHVALVAWISLTLSRHSSLSFIALGRSSGQHPVSSQSCWIYVRAGRPAFARPCVGVHKSTSLMSSSLLLQQCPACLVRPPIYNDGISRFSLSFDGCGTRRNCLQERKTRNDSKIREEPVPICTKKLPRIFYSLSIATHFHGLRDWTERIR